MVSGGRCVGRLAAGVLAVVVAVWLTAGVASAAQPSGVLTQLPGTTGCFTYNGASEDGAATCSKARGLAEGESATVSPDGANVYVGSYANGGASLKAGFAVFARNSTTGALSQLSGKPGCLTSDGSSSAGPGTCTKARGLFNTPGDGHDLVFTADGRWAYMAADGTPAALLIFQRDPSTGALTQLQGTAGCITTNGSSQDGAGTCQADPKLLGDSASGLSISSDDRFVYVTGTGGSHQIHVFSRNAGTGGLTEVECISQAPAPAGCSTGRVVGDTQFIALSPDSMHAYAGQYQFGISIFDRNPATGLLTQKAGKAGCITNDGKDDAGNSTCAIGRVTRGTFPLLIAPNGQTLYNGDGYIGFSTFHINGDGTLTQLTGANGCTTIDGKDNTGASTCAVGRAISSPYGGVISPDGSTLYISDDTSPVGGVAVFSLNPATGVATQRPGLEGCITADGSSHGTPGQCTNGRALAYGWGMSISPDGSSVYQATDAASNAGLAVYARETAPACQAATATTPFGRPVVVSLPCSDVDGDAVTRSIVSGPAHGTLSAVNSTTGTVTYTPATGFSGTDSFTFAASDGANSSASVTATITVGPQPAVSGLHVSPSKFSLAGRKVGRRCVKPTKKNRGNRHCRRALSLRIGYSLNVADTVTFTLKRQVSGRKVGTHCVKAKKKNGKHRKCERFTKLRGQIVKSGNAGANRFTFNGRIGGHTLGPGTYQLIATPASGRPRTVTFKLVS